MSTIDDLLPSSSSDSDEDVEEEAQIAIVKEPKVASVLTPVPPVIAVEDVKMEITPIVQPTVLKESIQKAFAESIWKPVIDKGGAAPKKKVSVDNAMEKERFLLMKSGQDQNADNLYKRRDLIKKHIKNAEQIVFGEDKDISSVRSFIEERYRLHFGLGPDGHPRELSAEEKEEVDFLIENSTFITKVILRMHDLEPEDYKGKIDNFHMQAKLAVFQEEKAIRDKELQDMNSERQRIFFQHKERSEQLSRARAGEESSDDDVDDDMEEGEDDLARRQTEIENELIKKMKEMKVEVNPEQVAICVSDMIAAMSIHTTPYERVRASSPPRQEDKSKPLIDLPWSAENDTNDDELLDETPEEVDLTEDAALRSIEGKHQILFDWSEDIFPDDDNMAVGEKRPLDVLDVLDFRPKRRAVEKNGNVEPKPMDTTPPPAHLRSCLKHHNEILTDINEDHLSVKERIKWRTAFETHAAKKKRVHFTDFDNPRNKCRFYVRPLDDGNITHRSDNLLKDVCKQATYVDCTLTHGRQIIYKNLRRQPAASASNSHDPEAFLKRLAKLRDSDKFVTKYSMEHPSQFLMLDIRELKSANGMHLPAFPGKEPPQLQDLSNGSRAHLLSCFRLSMQHFIQNRAGITKVNHIDEAKNLVAGILILSDSLLRAVEQKKLSNAVIQRFHPSQCAEDILEVLDRCSYEELDLRHCMLAWGHDLIAYFQQSPIFAAGQALASLFYIRATFQRKKQLFEQEGYRKRKLPTFWLLTIPEIGDFAQHFKIFNNLVRAVFNEHPDFRILDWAQEVEKSRTREKRRSPYTKIAVEQRLKQLFDLCRNEMDLTYFRYSNQKNVERAVAYSKHDYDSG